jgi:hypothetical protein
MAITNVQGNSTNTVAALSAVSLSFPAPVSPGSTVIAYFGVYQTTGTVIDDKGNVYTLLPFDVRGSYGVQIAYCININNGPQTITLNQASAQSYPFLIIDEFTGIAAYDQTIGNTTSSNVNAIPTGNITPASNGELLYTVVWSDSGPVTVDSPFAYIRDGASPNDNVADAWYVQPTAASIGATWRPPSSQKGVARIVAFSPTAPPPPIVTLPQIMLPN